MTWAALVRNAYRAAREWGIQPSEFWAMSPAEYWAEFDTKYEMAQRLKDGGKQGGKSPFSQAEWEDARRRHKERKRAKK